MTSFQAKNRLERPRKREKKNYRSVPTRRVIENSKKIQKYHNGSILSHHRLKEDEKGRK